MEPIPYAKARLLIQDGDMLLFQRRGWLSIVGRFITAAGRGIHCHVAMAVWWGKELFCVEMRRTGGRAVLLSSQVRRFPNCIDVRRIDVNRYPRYSASDAAEFMKRLCGSRYGWQNVALATLLHLPIIRMFVKPDIDDNSISRFPPHCSQGYASATRIGGNVDPVPGLADWLVEPPDLARSAVFERICRIGEVAQ